MFAKMVDAHPAGHESQILKPSRGGFPSQGVPNGSLPPLLSPFGKRNFSASPCDLTTLDSPVGAAPGHNYAGAEETKLDIKHGSWRLERIDAMRRASEQSHRAPSKTVSMIALPVKSALKRATDEGGNPEFSPSRRSGQEDPRYKAVVFEETLAAVFDLPDPNGKDKYDRAVERLEQEEYEAYQLQMRVKMKSDMEIALKRREELRRAREADQQAHKVVSAFSCILQKASVLISRKAGANLAMAELAVTPRDRAPFTKAVIADHTDAVMERQLEAVFVSYALFNKWDGEAMVVGHKCPGLSGCRFQSLCHDAGFLPNGQITDRTLKDIHGRHVDKASISQRISFPNFICALEELAHEGRMESDQVYNAVVALNLEKRICVHT
eukprot:jgi/Tetstr1/441609/TSEL_029836.t2